MHDIYIVSLERAGRRETIARQLAAFGLRYQFCDAVDAQQLSPEHIVAVHDATATHLRYGRGLTDGEVACFLSHRAVWNRIVSSGRPAIVLEDDALLMPGFARLLRALDDHDEARLPDVLLLGRSKLVRRRRWSVAFYEPLRNVVRIAGFSIGAPFKLWTSGAVGYRLTPAAAARMVQACSHRMTALLDDWPYHAMAAPVRVAEIRPYVVWEDYERISSSLEPERQRLSGARGRGWRAVVLPPLRVGRALVRWLWVLSLRMVG